MPSAPEVRIESHDDFLRLLLNRPENIQHPEAVTIRHNPEWKAWGDAYLSPKLVETILSESALGAVPVKGQGYRGRFGGPGWDRIWTDMSEIVRPTRDGIHGREFISTVVDIGSRPMHLATDGDGERPRYLQVQLPILFDSPPESAQSIEMARREQLRQL